MVKESLTNRNIIFVIASAALLVALLFGLGIFPFSTDSTQGQRLVAIKSSPSTTNLTSNNAIMRENALLGTTSWQIPTDHGATNEIQAYTNLASVFPGQELILYVSTQIKGTSYSINFYRLGWYAGLGGRLMLTIPHETGQAQGYYDYDQHRLVSCLSCNVDAQTGLVEANWQPSYKLVVPFNWTTGIYLAKFVDARGMQTYAPFVVKDHAKTRYIIATPSTTDAAYNRWGGYSLYVTYDGPESSTGIVTHGTKVSFNRPYVQEHGSGQILSGETDAIHWLESKGYDLTYISNVDLHHDPGQLLNHRAYISLGHDEYWTKEMRDGAELARNSGVSLAFLGANDIYWQMRFEPSSTGIADRTIVCYKVMSASSDLTRDPFYLKDNTRVTAQWRDSLIERPENALIGIMSTNHLNQEQNFPWEVNPQAKSPLLNGTGLHPGGIYGCWLVGNEWDGIVDNGNTPNNLQVIGESPTLDTKGYHDISNTTYYIASQGAMVFAAGSIYWTLALDSYRADTYPQCSGQNPVVPGIQQFMAHVMDALVANHHQ